MGAIRPIKTERRDGYKKEKKKKLVMVWGNLITHN